MGLDPFGAFFGIADRVERRTIDVDAAGKQLGVALGRSLQLLAAGRRMHTADQETRALAGFQQADGRIEPRLATGQNDDGVCRLRISRRGQPADMACEPAETQEIDDDCDQREQADVAQHAPQPGRAARHAERVRRGFGHIGRIATFHASMISAELRPLVGESTLPRTDFRAALRHRRPRQPPSVWRVSRSLR